MTFRELVDRIGRLVGDRTEVELDGMRVIVRLIDADCELHVVDLDSVDVVDAGCTEGRCARAGRE